MIFIANADNVVQKSHLLRALNSKVFPDLKAFNNLGFPLKQTLKIYPKEKGDGIEKSKTNTN